MKVAAADHRNVLRYPIPGIQNRLHGADCKRVIKGENGLWTRLAAKQHTHCLFAAPNTIDINDGRSDHQLV